MIVDVLDARLATLWEPLDRLRKLLVTHTVPCAIGGIVVDRDVPVAADSTVGGRPLDVEALGTVLAGEGEELVLDEVENGVLFSGGGAGFGVGLIAVVLVVLYWILAEAEGGCGDREGQEDDGREAHVEG
jgi:hypothetical protein